jgi:hypothetical protein
MNQNDSQALSFFGNLTIQHKIAWVMLLTRSGSQ